MFIVADRLLGALGVRPRNFSVSVDGGYPELFQYVKEAWIAAVFVVLFAKTRARIYLVWSVLFSYLLIDDAFVIHENLGQVLGRHLQFPAVMGLRPSDLGEALVLASVGALIGAFLAVTYRRAARAERRATRALLALLGMLVLFGVGLDIVHAAYKSAWIAFVEDGGEMLAVSSVAWYLHRRMDTLVAEYRVRMVPPAGF